jgi:2-keto-4-pentenoate hydratase/2-oxohepta-3-ene-1,7-dioic acid hydratase in catechol pathway
VKLVLFRPAGREGPPRPGIVTGGHRILDPAVFWAREETRPFPADLISLLASEAAPFCLRLARQHEEETRRSLGEPCQTDAGCHPFSEVELFAPLQHPPSFRDFYSFEEHVRRSRARRGQGVPEEWYRRPTFYFSNPNAIYGPGREIPRPASTRAMDYEVEIGCVISRPGKDISPAEAENWIAGFTLLNDWSARDVQREEMAVGLGPSKGKDFATSLGPFLVTPEELRPLRSGKGYEISLEVRRNGRLLGEGDWSSIQFSFEEMIAHASRDVWLLPGDLLGSGTVGGGCILEIGPEDAGGWLEPGDEIEIAGGPLGVLKNRIGTSGARDGHRADEPPGEAATGAPVRTRPPRQSEEA